MFTRYSIRSVAAFMPRIFGLIGNAWGKPFRTLTGVGLMLLFALLLVPSGANAQATDELSGTSSGAQVAGCGLAWRVVPSPDPGTPLPTLLHGVAAVSATDIWAVGLYYEGTISKAIIMRWDGIQWNVIPTPDLGAGSSALHSVTAVSPTDVWAVGYRTVTSQQALILHWNGQAWSVASTSGVTSGYLQSVSAASANNVWAVGFIRDGNFNRALVMRWNGSAWSRVSVPHAGMGENYLFDIDVVSANSAWAVGYYCDTSDCTTDVPSKALIIRWNGTAWSIVTSPNPGAHGNFLGGVAASSANDVWAVGNYGNTEAEGKTLTLRWNGSVWSVTPSPNAPLRESFLTDVVSIAANNVWAIGNSRNDTEGWEQMIMRWNGIAWNNVAGPASGLELNDILADIAALSASDLVIVGQNEGNSLVERYNDPGLFSDVTPSHPFYQYITCLACRGIIGGYADGTFRPNNPITRGQLSKIVSESAGFTENPATQRFEDVPPTHTFYAPIHRLANRGILGGYPCGGPGEPCGPNNRPYFRPGRDVTRGQIAKIVSNTAGYSEAPSTQRFEDVPPAHPFYPWVERLASRAVMDGYACGTLPQEPCVAPANRAYFRWGLAATREQVAKITANTFFPNCQTP